MADVTSDRTAENGKWRKVKADKRRAVEPLDKLSKRERTKQNKLARDIPILPQHTVAKFAETDTYK